MTDSFGISRDQKEVVDDNGMSKETFAIIALKQRQAPTPISYQFLAISYHSTVTDFARFRG